MSGYYSDRVCYEITLQTNNETNDILDFENYVNLHGLNSEILIMTNQKETE